MTNFSTLFTPVSVTIANAKEVSQNITINLVNSSEVSDLSAKTISTYTTVQSNSANWQSTYNTFNSTSSTYLTAIPQNITINSISAISLSGTFYGDGSNLIGASLPGQAQINTTVVVNSANWNTAYINVSSQSLNIDSNVQFKQVNANVYLSGGVNLFNLLSSTGGGGTAEKRFDYTTVLGIDYSYSGTAIQDTPETSFTWNLIRLTYNNNGTIFNQASAINSWTDRLTATYV